MTGSFSPLRSRPFHAACYYPPNDNSRFAVRRIVRKDHDRERFPKPRPVGGELHNDRIREQFVQSEKPLSGVISEETMFYARL